MRINTSIYEVDSQNLYSPLWFGLAIWLLVGSVLRIGQRKNLYEEHLVETDKALLDRDDNMVNMFCIERSMDFLHILSIYRISWSLVFHKYSVFWPSKPLASIYQSNEFTALFWPSKPLAWIYLYFRLKPVESIYCPIETIKEDLWP